MIKSTFPFFLRVFLFFVHSVGFAANEWVHPNTPGCKRNAIVAIVNLTTKQFNRFELGDLGGHPDILQPGVQTAYAKDSEVALSTLAKIFGKVSSASMKIVNIGSGLGIFDMFIPFISDGSRPIEITLVEPCEAYFTVFDSMEPIRIMHPSNITFNKIPCLVQNLLGSLKRGSFSAVTCLNLLHLLSDQDQVLSIRNMLNLLEPNGVLIASCLTCIAGHLKTQPPEPGRYMAKVTADAEREGGGVNNFVEEFVRLSDDDITNYTPQSYYIFESGAYLSKSLEEIVDLARAGSPTCYRYSHIIDKPEFLRMFSGYGFQIECSGEYNFGEAGETSLLAGLATSCSGVKGMKGVGGFYIVAKKLDV